MKPTIKVMLEPGATMPTRAHGTDSGWDIRALSTRVIYRTLENEEWSDMPLSYQDTKIHYSVDWRVMIDTGVHLQPPPGWGFSLRPNSRNGKSWWRYAFSPGTIDQPYTGSIKVMLEPRKSWVLPIMAPNPGDVCGQLILERIYDMELQQVDKLEETERGNGGFGSTERRGS